MIVGYVGLGAIGAPMAANLAARFDTRVWNRTTAVATDHAVAHGSTAVADLDELAAVDVVCSCLPTDAEVAPIAARLGPLLRPGTIWLDHTSGDAAGSRTIGEALATHGVGYLDAPVSGGTDGARNGTLTVMVGGEAKHLEVVRDVLDAVAGRVVHVGPSGAGMAVKAVNQGLLAAALWSAAEGLVALARAGVPAHTALEVVNSATGRSFATERLLPERALTRAFPLTFALGLLAKDASLATRLAASTGVDAPLLRLVDERTAAASAQLGGGVDHVSLVRVVEEQAGAELT